MLIIKFSLKFDSRLLRMNADTLYEGFRAGQEE